MGPRRIAVAALAALLVTAPDVRAEDFCVGDPPCLATLAEALDAARAGEGPDRVLLPGGEHEAPAGPADGIGEPVEIVGAGTATRIVPETGATSTLWLAEPASRVTALTLASPGPGATETLLLAGVAGRVVVSAPAVAGAPAVRMLAGARLGDALVAGSVVATAPARVERSVLMAGDGAAVSAEGGTGVLVLESSELHLDGADAAVEASCADVAARHLTIVGTATRAFDAACPEEPVLLSVRNSVVDAQFDDGLARADERATISSAHSAHAEDVDVAATERLETADPGFVSESDLSLRDGSPLVDAGEPGPLAAGEGFWDRGSRSRVTDGDGNGELRRDIGAHELQSPPPVVPAGNVLFNPGAEQGTSIMTVGEGPEPPGWTRTGAFTQVAYGTTTRTAQGDVALPSRETGAALGAGSAFFSAGPGESARLLQRIDVAGSAREIDAGVGSAALSALLGGYGADEDEVRVTARFRDPEGNSLAAIEIGPVPAAERGNATNLVPRATAGAIPARTRAIDVEIGGTRMSAPGSAETYADAFADNVALVLSVPGVPVPGPVNPETTPPVKNLRPFSGIAVLTGRPRLSSRGRTRIGIACASATVGRCTGTLELRAQLRRGLAFTRIAQFARFSLAPGRSTMVTVKLTLAARRALRRAKSFRATLRAVVQDGQGLERRTTIPIRVVRSAARRR